MKNNVIDDQHVLLNITGVVNENNNNHDTEDVMEDKTLNNDLVAYVKLKNGSTGFVPKKFIDYDFNIDLLI